MKKTMGFFLMIALSCLSAAAAEVTGTFPSTVPDHTSVEIMGIPANRIELNYTLNNGSADVSAQKAAVRTRVPDRMLQSTELHAFKREYLSFTPDWGSLTRVSKGPEFLVYQREVMPVQQGTTQECDRNRFAEKSTEYAVIRAQYAVVERLTDSRIEAKRSNGRKSGGTMWMMGIVA